MALVVILKNMCVFECVWNITLNRFMIEYQGQLPGGYLS